MMTCQIRSSQSSNNNFMLRLHNWNKENKENNTRHLSKNFGWIAFQLQSWYLLIQQHHQNCFYHIAFSWIAIIHNAIHGRYKTVFLFPCSRGIAVPWQQSNMIFRKHHWRAKIVFHFIVYLRPKYNSFMITCLIFVQFNSV